MELETAKDILAEVFHTRPSEVEDTIQRKLVERNRHEGEEIWKDRHEKGRVASDILLG